MRHPAFMPLARWSVRKRWLAKPLLVTYMLYSEWLVTEQNCLYDQSRGLKRVLRWAPIDFTQRVVTKGFLRVVGSIGGRVVQRMATRLQMGDERVVAHME